MRCPYPLYFSTALRMHTKHCLLRTHTKHCLLRTHLRVHRLTWLAVPARPYYSHSCLLQDYSSSSLVSTTFACPVVWSWVGNITWRSGQIRASSQSSSNCGRHRRRPSLVDKFSPVRTPVFATSSLSSVLCDFFSPFGPPRACSHHRILLNLGFFVVHSSWRRTHFLPPVVWSQPRELLLDRHFLFPFVCSLSRRTHLIRPDPCLGTCQPSKPFLDRRTFTSSSPCHGGRRRTCSDLLWSLPTPGTLVGFFLFSSPLFVGQLACHPAPVDKSSPGWP